MNKVESALQRTTDTKALVIGSDALPRSAEMFKELFPGKRAIIVADKITYPLAGEAVRTISTRPVSRRTNRTYTVTTIRSPSGRMSRELENVLKKTDAIPVAVGSGVINDLTKLTAAHRCGRRYMCVGTAASMDGYTAYGASITYQGNKQTFDCPAPYGMALDPRIAAKAPKAMSASGYADLIAKIPAGADWMIADVVGSEAIDRFAFDLVQDGLQEALSDPEGVYNGDVKKVEQLAEGLLLSGFAMQAAKSSRPASGMEHQFSHFWDMEDLEFEGKHVSHGFKVGIGTLASTASLELLLAAPIESLDIDACVAKWKSWEETEKEILRIFDGKPGFIDRALTETKNKYVDKEGLRRGTYGLQGRMARAERAHPQADHSLRRGFAVAETGRRSLRAGAAGCFARPLPRHVRQDSLHAQPFLEYRHRLSLRVHGRVARTAVRQGRYLGSK